MRKHFALASVLLTLGMATASAQAQQSQTGAEKPKTSQPSDTGKAPSDTGKSGEKARTAINAVDRQSMIQAAEGGLAEVEAGKLGASKATNDDVKKFGQRMVDEHTKANDELKSLAEKKNVTLPSEVTKTDKASLDRLGKLSGDQFDRAYMTHMVADHRKAVGLFQKMEKTAKDPDLKQWATNTLPTLQDHLKQAQTIESQIRAKPAQKTSQR